MRNHRYQTYFDPPACCLFLDHGKRKGEYRPPAGAVSLASVVSKSVILYLSKMPAKWGCDTL
jgi:hypothetical protein